MREYIVVLLTTDIPNQAKILKLIKSKINYRSLSQSANFFCGAY